MKGSMKLLACAAALVFSIACFGCSSGASGNSSSTESQEPSSVEASAQASSEAASSSSAQAQESVAESASQQTPVTDLADGEYQVEVTTDSNMFHLNEAAEGMGTLTVEGGNMTVHMSLASKRIVKLYAGTADQAQSDEAGALEPTTDKMTYSDGYEEEVYGFDVPVPALDQEFDVAILGTKGKWYDHKVIVSHPKSDQ